MLPQVMILEDDPLQMQLLVRNLSQKMQICPIQFCNADDAISSLTNSSYNFLAYILDIEIKNQQRSGIDVAEKIREKDHNSYKPIIFLSSYTHFGFGALNHLHYYEFVNKDSNWFRISNVLQRAISNISDNDDSLAPLVLNTTRFQYEIDAKNVSCIELYANEVVITDLIGIENIYKVRPHAFSDLCNQLANSKFKYLQQMHRSIIINLHRIQKIEWHKNTATVWLFNVARCKPVGKTYLEKLKIFKE